MDKLKHKCAKLNIDGQIVILTVGEIIRRNYTHKDLKAYLCRDVFGNRLTKVEFRNSKVKKQSHLRICHNGCGSHGRGGRGHVDYNPNLSTEHLQAQRYLQERIKDIDIFTICPCCQQIVERFIGKRHDNVELEKPYINNHKNNIRVDLVINNEVVYEVYNTHKTEKESRECDEFIYGGEIIASHIIKKTEDAGDHSRILLNAYKSNIECIKCDEKKAKEAIRLAKDAEKTASAIRIQANIRRRLMKNVLMWLRLKKREAHKKAQAEREAAHQVEIRKRQREAQAEIRKRQRVNEPPVTYQDIDHLDDDAKNSILQFIKIFCNMKTYEWNAFDDEEVDIPRSGTDSATIKSFLLGKIVPKIKIMLPDQGDAKFRICLKKEIALRNSNVIIALIRQRVDALRSNFGKECEEFDMKITYAEYFNPRND